ALAVEIGVVELGGGQAEEGQERGRVGPDAEVGVAAGPVVARHLCRAGACRTRTGEAPEIAERLEPRRRARRGRRQRRVSFRPAFASAAARRFARRVSLHASPARVQALVLEKTRTARKADTASS